MLGLDTLEDLSVITTTLGLAIFFMSRFFLDCYKRET